MFLKLVAVGAAPALPKKRRSSPADSLRDGLQVPCSVQLFVVKGIGICSTLNPHFGIPAFESSNFFGARVHIPIFQSFCHSAPCFMSPSIQLHTGVLPYAWVWITRQSRRPVLQSVCGPGRRTQPLDGMMCGTFRLRRTVYGRRFILACLAW